MDSVMILGLTAGLLTTASFLPQVIKTWKTHSAKDLSYGMIILFISGISLWCLYGIWIESLPIILANAVTILFLVVLLAMKIWYER